MGEVIYQAISLVLIILVFIKIALPLGGLFYALFATSVKIPYVGTLINFLLNKRVKLIIIPKITGWIISSSGLILAHLLYSEIFGSVSEEFEFQIFAFFGIIQIINITQYLTSFNIDTYSEYVIPVRDMYKQFFKDDDLDYILSDFNNHMALSRSLFLDLYLPQLFRLVIAIAVLSYSLSNLGYIDFNSKVDSVSLWESIKAAFTIIPLVDSKDIIFKGDAWNILNSVAKFLLFLWSIFFIASAQSMFMDEGRVKDSFPSQEEIMDKKIDSIVQEMKEKFLEKGNDENIDNKNISNEATKKLDDSSKLDT